MFCWTKLLDGPPVLYCNKAIAIGHQVYSFRGNTNNKQIDVSILNTVSLRWTKLNLVTPGTGEPHLEVPSGREGYSAVLIEDAVYLWGGLVMRTNQGPWCNVLYAFDLDAHRWSKPQVSGTVPEGRWNHAACVLGKVLYIHGGWTQTRRTDDMYKLDTNTMFWSLINTRGTVPPALSGHSANIIGTKMFVFGGYMEHRLWGSDNITIRVFDTKTDFWLESVHQCPKERCLHSGFTHNGRLYIFGSSNGHHDFNDLWRFNPETFHWKKVEPKGKGPCPTSRMCCCMVGDRVVLLGGDKMKRYTVSSDDLCVLDFSPSFKSLCKLAVIQYGLDQSELPHNIRWELANSK